MKAIMQSLLIILLFSLVAGCAQPLRYDGPYLGRVIDADTREPIEGVVVLGTWSVMHPNVAGGYHTFYDARETVTDGMGEFTIPGMGLRVFSRLEPMSVLIFKSGYSYIGSTSWDALKISSYYREMIKWEGDRAIFPIRKLTMAERKKDDSMPIRPLGTVNKMKLITKELNRERAMLGFEPFDVEE